MALGPRSWKGDLLFVNGDLAMDDPCCCETPGICELILDRDDCDAQLPFAINYTGCFDYSEAGIPPNQNTCGIRSYLWDNPLDLILPSGFTGPACGTCNCEDFDDRVIPLYRSFQSYGLGVMEWHGGGTIDGNGENPTQEWCGAGNDHCLDESYRVKIECYDPNPTSPLKDWICHMTLRIFWTLNGQHTWWIWEGEVDFPLAKIKLESLDLNVLRTFENIGEDPFPPCTPPAFNTSFNVKAHV